ncbi:MAG TPA: DUF1622 domain-containing protein [Burkholderiales bacterium]
MIEELKSVFGIVGLAVEGAGVLAMLLGCGFATLRYLGRLPVADDVAYHNFRRGLGRSIMIGLEYMIAGDIIRTVTVDTTLESAAVLAAIVLIRAFLTMTLAVEVEGRWPWQRAGDAPARER